VSSYEKFLIKNQKKFQKPMAVPRSQNPPMGKVAIKEESQGREILIKKIIRTQ
jgi:hypothetical protein